MYYYRTITGFWSASFLTSVSGIDKRTFHKIRSDFGCLMYGIILADTWHRDFANLASMAETIEEEGPNGYIQDLVEDVLGFTPKLFSQWMEAVYITAMTDLGSIRESGEQYTLKILPASYQLGVSMMLSHYGL